MGGSYSLRISMITSSEAKAAFAYHKSEADPHIWTRTPEAIQEYAEQGQLFGIRRTDSGAFVGLCYVNADFEFGGLMVQESHQKMGLGTLLGAFALAQTIVYNDPWSAGGKIVAHVHEANEKPRQPLERLGFEFSSKVDATAFAPEGMKRNADGRVIGDELVLTPKAAHRVLEHLARCHGHVGPDKLPVEFHLGPTPYALADLLTDLREILAAHGG